MTKEETKQYLDILKTSGLEVMEAYVAGKTIQFRADDSHKWGDTNFPNWFFNTGQYRVKPEPKWRPYSGMLEFAKEMVRLDRNIIMNMCDPSLWYTIEAMDAKTVALLGKDNTTIHRNYQELLEHYEWANGDFCGILETDDNE